MPSGAEPQPGQSELEAPLEVVVSPDLAGHRADDVLLRALVNFTRKEVRQLFEAGRVRGGGRVLRKGDRVTTGLALRVDAPRQPIAPDASIPLDVLFESPDFVIVNKPAGLPTAPLVRTENRSLAAALLSRYPEMQGVGFREREPGLVHRLDNETSGVVLAARSQQAFQAARDKLESSAIQKRYWAVVAAGLGDDGCIETIIGPDPAQPGRVRVFLEAPSGYARHAKTRYRVRIRGAAFCLVELAVERAFRHQIRVHLAHLGFPIAGDALYAGAVAPELGKRHALHASYIAWAGDETRAGFEGEAPLPRELGALVGP